MYTLLIRTLLSQEKWRSATLFQKFHNLGQNTNTMIVSFITTLLIACLYAWLGKKLGASPVKWGIAGFGIVITCLLLGFLLTLIAQEPATRLTIWVAMYLVSWIASMGLAVVIAYRNKLIAFK